MLDLISVECSSGDIQEVFYERLLDQLNASGRRREEQSTSGLHICLWRDSGVIVLAKEQPTRFPMKALLGLIEEYSSTDWQIWTRLKLNESTLRQFRKMETEGTLKSFSCYLLDHRGLVTDYKELERIVKISQNKPLGAIWVSENEISSLITSKRMFHQYRLVYPVQVLEKISSADTEPVETPLSYMMRQYYSKAKNRKIHWYPKKYVHKKMDEEKWGVDPLPKSKQGSVKRHVLVTGTGRSGTTYFSDLLTMLGLDVGHQRNGKDGCSGAEFAVDHDWYPWFPVYGGGDCANVGERRSDYTYTHVLHIVRHPLWCIPSLMRNYPAINPEFWADNGTMDPKAMDGSSAYRNAAMYYGINQVIDKSKQAEYRCQLEQIHEHWETLMDILEMPRTKDPKLGATNKATGWGQYEPLTWAELEFQVGKELADKIHAQAKRYGYE